MPRSGYNGPGHYRHADRGDPPSGRGAGPVCAPWSPTRTKRFELYRDLAFDEARTIVKIAASRRNACWSSSTPIPKAGLGRFILAELKQQPLFYNSAQPSAVIFQVLAAFVWRKLDMAGRAPNFGGMDIS